jgi:hypothetical protein
MGNWRIFSRMLAGLIVAKFSLRFRSEAFVQVPPVVTYAPLAITKGPSVGVEVPIPTLPAWVTVTNCVPVEEAITKGLVPAVPWMKRVEAGVEVPIPTLPSEVTLSIDVDVPEEEAISNKPKLGELDVPEIFTRALSVAAPMPTRPSLRTVKTVDVAEFISLKIALDESDVSPCTRSALLKLSTYLPGPTLGALTKVWPIPVLMPLSRPTVEPRNCKTPAVVPIISL